MEKLKKGDRVKVTFENGFLLGKVVNLYPDKFLMSDDLVGITAYVPYKLKWEKIPSSKEVESTVVKPKHYIFSDGTEAKTFINKIAERYKQGSVAYHVGNCAKYIIRAPFKNGLEDLKKAQESLGLAIECWCAKDE
ncbi:DUF3310 domain-containing protein [Staphylococcus americanisciuri]|uniref:DUF3310 domain-containing protein n=1 Tax=Staphylococcus americanisciuri TaxID=2973940 RepID=A0ABT2F1N8_9STAP|nr:DUF3310 domain-containing protein [Staphylococcus americanisciuri]MCS4486361.1 DUF3310 domain-containing protein [Staphylococcus americanisciuri]